MKAMIFAAGVGSRLAPFTNHHPKALVEVGGMPMLGHTILRLKEAGIEDIVVNVHHLAGQIVDYLHTNNNFGLDIAVSDESTLLLDTGGGLLKARDLLLRHNPEDPILLHNADILTDAPLTEMLASHLATAADATLLCSHRDSSRTLYFDHDGRLAGWQNLKTGETRPSTLNLSSTNSSTISTGSVDASPFGGVHIVNPTIFPLLAEYAEPGVPFSIIPFYLDNITRLDIRRYLLPATCRWHDVGSPSKLAAARTAFP